jgi:hypothetical protein
MRKMARVAFVLIGAILIGALAVPGPAERSELLQQLASGLEAWTSFIGLTTTIAEPAAPAQSAGQAGATEPAPRLAWRRPPASAEESTSIEPAEPARAEPARALAVPPGPRMPIGQASNADGPAIDPVTLVRELQRELHRVGCYSAQVTGLWTPSTRRAMQEFMGRANASLPVDKPDEVLLALVRSFPGKACGAPCPPGESLTPAGRCVPGVAADGVARPARSPENVLSAAPGITVPPAPTPGLAPVATVQAPHPDRMALAGPGSQETTTLQPATTAKRIKHSERSRHVRRQTQRAFGPWIFSDAPTDSPFRR